MPQFKRLFILLNTLGIFTLVTINYAVSESLNKLNRSSGNDEYRSLSAPSSDSPLDKTDRRDYTERNLTAPPPSSGASKHLISPTSDELKKPSAPSSHTETR